MKHQIFLLYVCLLFLLWVKIDTWRTKYRKITTKCNKIFFSFIVKFFSVTSPRQIEKSNLQQTHTPPSRMSPFFNRKTLTGFLIFFPHRDFLILTFFGYPVEFWWFGQKNIPKVKIFTLSKLPQNRLGIIFRTQRSSTKSFLVISQRY